MSMRIPVQKSFDTTIPGRIIGWDMAKAGDVTCYVEGSVDADGRLIIEKCLFGQEAEEEIRAYQMRARS